MAQVPRGPPWGIVCPKPQTPAFIKAPPQAPNFRGTRRIGDLSTVIGPPCGTYWGA